MATARGDRRRAASYDDTRTALAAAPWEAPVDLLLGGYLHDFSDPF